MDENIENPVEEKIERIKIEKWKKHQPKIIYGKMKKVKRR